MLTFTLYVCVRLCCLLAEHKAHVRSAQAIAPVAEPTGEEILLPMQQKKRTSLLSPQHTQAHLSGRRRLVII